MNNFFKELILKNDLTYLCLSLPLIISFLPNKLISFFIVGGSAILLTYSWLMTVKKRYIFNSKLKFFGLIALSIASINLLTITHPYVKAMKISLELIFVVLYISYVMITAYCLASNPEEHYEGEYHPEFEDVYQRETYLRSIYSSMNANNTFNYHYDRDIDTYIYYDNLYENLETDTDKKIKISTLQSYVNYLNEHGLSSKQMNKEELSVFRMFAI